MIEGHYSAKFDVLLTELSNETLMMGRLVEKQLRFAIRALVDGDLLLAAQVAKTEDQVNRLEVDIDAKCIQLLALRQPKASDLRFVLMVIKTVNDLERMGDEVCRVALMGSRVTERPGEFPNFSDIQELGLRVSKLLHETLIAFEQTDEVRSLELIRHDKKVDKEFRATLKRIRKWMMSDPDSVPDAVDILYAIRSLERVGDRSCNICEHVIFFVKGEDIRHLNIDDIAN